MAKVPAGQSTQTVAAAAVAAWDEVLGLWFSSSRGHVGGASRIKPEWICVIEWICDEASSRPPKRRASVENVLDGTAVCHARATSGLDAVLSVGRSCVHVWLPRAKSHMSESVVPSSRTPP